MLGRLLPEARRYCPRPGNLNLEPGVTRQPRSTDGGAEGDAVVHAARCRTSVDGERGGLPGIPAPRASLAGLNRLISPLFLTKVSHL